MLLGIGTDILQASRLRDVLERQGDRFAQRILTTEEFKAFQAHTQPTNMLAKRFAIKEAVAKALGTGIGQGVSWQHMEVVHSDTGAPAVVLTERAREVAEELGGSRVMVSVSDEKDYVVAFAVLTTGV